jgi:hypothetical protein
MYKRSLLVLRNYLRRKSKNAQYFASWRHSLPQKACKRTQYAVELGANKKVDRSRIQHF